MKTTSDVIQSASVHLTALTGHVFDLLTISKPIYKVLNAERHKADSEDSVQ